MTQPLRVVSSTNKVGHLQQPANKDRIGNFVPFTIASGDVSEIVLSFDRWYRIGGDELNADGTTLYASIQNNSTSVPVTVNGTRLITLASGCTEYLSDPIPASAFGLTKFSKGETYYYKDLEYYPPGANVMLSYFSTSSEGQGMPSCVAAAYNSNEASLGNGPIASSSGPLTAGDLATVDQRSNFGGTGSGIVLLIQAYRPHILGRFVSGDPLTMVAVIDSINDVGGYETNQGFEFEGSDQGDPNNGGIGWQGAQHVAGGPIAYLNMARSAGSAPNTTKTQGYFKYARVLFDEMGANEQSSGVVGTQANENRMWSAARAAGVEKIIRTKVFPRTNSATLFVAPQDQTPQDSNFDAFAASINSWLDTKLADGTIDFVLPCLSVRDPNNFAFWRVGSQQQMYVGDGTHPAYTGRNLIGADIAAALSSLPYASGSGSSPAPAPTPSPAPSPTPGTSTWALRSGPFAITSGGYVVPLI